MTSESRHHTYHLKKLLTIQSPPDFNILYQGSILIFKRRLLSYFLTELVYNARIKSNRNLALKIKKKKWDYRTKENKIKRKSLKSEKGFLCFIFAVIMFLGQPPIRLFFLTSRSSISLKASLLLVISILSRIAQGVDLEAFKACLQGLTFLQVFLLQSKKYGRLNY